MTTTNGGPLTAEPGPSELTTRETMPYLTRMAIEEECHDQLLSVNGEMTATRDFTTMDLIDNLSEMMLDIALIHIREQDSTVSQTSICATTEQTRLGGSTSRESSIQDILSETESDSRSNPE